jgi:NAD-dependent dihydropyrimidine dehydrogenase PreA subunit
VIEIISAAACIDCDKCVEVCPTNVFDPVPGGHPVIARQADCQTCFMCEAYCPADALYVAPFRGPVADLPTSSGRPATDLDEARLAAAGRFGEYRRWIGWGAGRRPGARRDANAELPELAAAHLGDATLQ